MVITSFNSLFAYKSSAFLLKSAASCRFFFLFLQSMCNTLMHISIFYDYLWQNVCISAICFVTLHVESEDVRKDTNICTQGQSKVAIKRPMLLPAATRYSHVRHKILPRPLQDFATGGASIICPDPFPFSIGSNPFSYVVYPPVGRFLLANDVSNSSFAY